MRALGGGQVSGINPETIGLELRIGKVARENAATKARRLLVEGRVLVRYAGPEGIRAFVRGDSGCLRRVSYDSGRWDCDCPARGDKCSHVMAVQAVTLISDARIPPGGYEGGSR